MGRVLFFLVLALPGFALAASGDYTTKKAYRYVTEPKPLTKAPQTLTYLHGGPRPKFSAGVKLGGGFPVGDFALFHSAGPVLGLDFAYRYLPDHSVEVTTLGFAHPFKGVGGEAPFSSFGFTVKSLTDFWRVEAISSFAGLGVGWFRVQRTREKLRAPTLTSPQYEAVTENTTALSLMGCFGIHYQLQGPWALRLEVQLIDLNLTGGTSDNLLMAQPTLGLRRNF